jgi:hypothetical protein
MAEPNPDTWAQSHMRWLALSRWDNEGGASPFRPTAGSAGASLRRDIRPSATLAGRNESVLLLIGFEASVSPIRQAPG